MFFSIVFFCSFFRPICWNNEQMFSKNRACLQDTFHNCSFVGCVTSVCQANQAVSLHERMAARFWLYSRQLGWLAASQMDLQPRAARPKRTLAEYEKMLREIASDKACLSCWLEIIVPYLDRTGCCAAPCVPCGSKFNACHVFLRFLQRRRLLAPQDFAQRSHDDLQRLHLRPVRWGRPSQMTAQMTAARKARRSHEENRNSLPNFGLVKPHMRFPRMRTMEHT